VRKICGVFVWSCVAGMWCSVSWAQARDVLVNAMLSDAQNTLSSKSIEEQDFMESVPAKAPEIRTEIVTFLDVSDVPLEEVFNRIARETGLVFILTEPISDKVSISVTEMNVWDLLKILLAQMDLAYYRTDGAVHVMRAATFVSRYGYDFPVPLPAKTVAVQYADPVRLRAKLEGVKGPEGRIWADVKNRKIMMIDAFESLQTMQTIIRESDQPVETRSLSLKYLSYGDVRERLEPMLRKGIEQVSVDPEEQTVTLTGTAAAIDTVFAFLSQQDRQQTLTFRVEILRIDLNREYPQGIDWEAIVSNYQVATLSTLGGDDREDQASIELGTLTREDYDVLIEALDTAGELNDLISFEQTLAQGKTQSLIVETNDPFWALRPGARRDPGHPAMLDSSGFEMEASVGWRRRDDRFVMDFLPRLHWMQGGPRDIIYSSKAAAEIEFNPAEVIVVGGLIRTEQTARTRKVPLLGDLPMVGGVFRLEQKKSESKEYVIFLKLQPEAVTE